ncbi:uncharacterized protein LACBIDRAFT_313995 [Laccaria bicolor S238N-H82]|uniref:Predicted protein n=1 Tax=Laccaria bicolor (strain S238N-H82 / ATCC MYA-4686) TaxID=486041 RepID=B0D1C1_LACBS|nr:uncharacterized protein LACBIDRAFT_313995 [Laccaria bicolor S238N-H82]EDR11974.1 predicted protein [Laccaria bicolor S238N-H82]|eukprot:XP_001877871.1 predicted protein [Laccaria bicolor S238N-H82]
MPKHIQVHWRALRPLLFLLAFLGLVTYYFYHTSRPPYQLYTTIATTETKESNKLVGNSRGHKYVKFKQLRGAGFNNQAQEILLYHHLALQTNRVYVYQPLIWRPRGEKATVPLSAFLSGPTKGSINEEVFNKICPEGEVTHVQLFSGDYETQWAHAKSVLEGNDRCVVVDDWIFNWNFLASAGTHPIWPTFQKYLANHFEWSSDVLRIVDRVQNALNFRDKPSSKDRDSYVALHLRRGDFEEHCRYLGETHTGFTTWATLPLISDSILPPTLDVNNGTSVMEHCYPSLHRILDAITHQVRSRPHLRTIHILHDGAWDHPLVYLQYYKLREALTNSEWAEQAGWAGGPMRRVTQSADAPKVWGEGDWAVCVDVELARRAEVFIGNGYSSLSTQVVALRLGADGGQPEDITFV